MGIVDKELLAEGGAGGVNWEIKLVTCFRKIVLPAVGKQGDHLRA